MIEGLTQDSLQLARLGERMVAAASDSADMAEQIKEVRTDLKAVNARLDAIALTLSEARGGWRMLVGFGGACAVAAEGLHQLVTHLVFTR